VVRPDDGDREGHRRGTSPPLKPAALVWRFGSYRVFQTDPLGA
jgi:hypothetical protein